MQIALFVEGSGPVGVRSREQDPPSERARDRDHLSYLWNECLLDALGRVPVKPIIPIGKDAISRLRGLTTSTSTSGLDARIDQARKSHALDPERDAIVIAWDLVPIDPNQRRCPWDEKVGLYRGLAESEIMCKNAEPWARSAKQQAETLLALKGQEPRAESVRRVVPGSVLGLCMEPMFEGLLTRNGRAIRTAFGLSEDPKNWPTGWRPDHPDPSRLLGRAVAALRNIRPKTSICKQIFYEPWENAKDEQGAFILRQLLAEPSEAEHIRKHAIALRLAHILPPRSQR